MYKPLTQNIQAGCLVWYFNLRIIHGTDHKLRSFWARPYRVMKIIGGVNQYPTREEKLVSLDMLKLLYWGEDLVRQNPVDLDPD